MGAQSKIVDTQEVLRWFEEGRTYAWMIEQYLKKYNIETSISMWSNYRRRNGLERRQAWDEDLIPWHIKLEHNHKNPIMMLRKVARQRAGLPVSEKVEAEIAGWLRNLDEQQVVVGYDPDTEEGWFYFPRTPEDTDIIRRPSRSTKRKSA